MPATNRLRLVAAASIAALATVLASTSALAPVGAPAAAPSSSADAVLLAAKKPSASRASAYLAKAPKPTSAAAALDLGLGLATTGCAHAKQLRTLRAYLVKKASGYATTAAAAGKLAILAVALGDSPKAFGGVNLVARIEAKTSASGKADGKEFAFGQALAMIGLARAGRTPSAAMVSALVDQQHGDGGFGYGASDPDSTGMALMALSPKVIGTPGAEAKSAIAKAKSWASAHRKPAGYWDNFSPVDSTGLIGSALRLHGVNTAKSVAWLGTKQLANGGFSNTRTGKTANRLATAEALYLITGKSLVTLAAPLTKCSK